jgi:hypothetical protein
LVAFKLIGLGEIVKLPEVEPETVRVTGRTAELEELLVSVTVIDPV